jgi:hypothetical protein
MESKGKQVKTRQSKGKHGKAGKRGGREERLGNARESEGK